MAKRRLVEPINPPAKSVKKEPSESKPANPLVRSQFLKLSKQERQDIYARHASKGQFYLAEPASSGHSKCRSCNEKIAKDELRLRHFVCGSACFTEKRTGLKDACGSFHVGCLFKNQDDVEVHKRTNANWKPLASLNQIAGVEYLDADQLAYLQKFV
jgi:hypothetical protein